MPETGWFLIVVIAAVIVYAVTVLAVMLKKRVAVKKNTDEQPDAIDLDPVIVAGIERNALRFMGLYEGIYTAVETHSVDAMDAYREWYIRMGNLQEDGDFCQAFSSRFPQTGARIEHLQELLSHIYAANIRRNEECVHTANQKTDEQYIYMGADALCIGEEYKVLKPCWLHGQITVQQGLLIPMEGK